MESINFKIFEFPGKNHQFCHSSLNGCFSKVEFLDKQSRFL